MFKVGDIVRCIEQPPTSCYQIAPGEILKIAEIYKNSYIKRDMHLRTDPGECFNSKYFEPYSSFTLYGKSYPLGEVPNDT